MSLAGSLRFVSSLRSSLNDRGRRLRSSLNDRGKGLRSSLDDRGERGVSGQTVTTTLPRTWPVRCRATASAIRSIGKVAAIGS